MRRISGNVLFSGEERDEMMAVPVTVDAGGGRTSDTWVPKDGRQRSGTYYQPTMGRGIIWPEIPDLDGEWPKTERLHVPLGPPFQKAK